MNTYTPIIIGHGAIDAFATTMIPSTTGLTIAVVDEKVKPSYADFSEPIAFNARPPIPDLFEGKQFICKGKHQYREYDKQWVCQCGRSL